MSNEFLKISINSFKEIIHLLIIPVPLVASAARLTRGLDPTTTLIVTWTRGANNAASVKHKVSLVTDGSDGTFQTASEPQTHTFRSLAPGQKYLVLVWAVAVDGAGARGYAISNTLYTGEVSIIMN